MSQFSLTDAHLNKKIYDVKDNFRYPTLINNIMEVIETCEILEKEVQTTQGQWY